MDNDKVKSDLTSSGTQIVATIIITALCALIGFVFSLLFRNNAYPLDNDYLVMYSEEWAAIFFRYFIIATCTCFFINLIALILAVYAKGRHRSTGSWFIWLALSFFTSLIFCLLFFIRYPEDTWCMIAALILLAAEPILIFVISTLFASNMWKRGYNPFCR